jgi:hypothetical protein
VSRETAFHEPAANPREIEGMLYYLTERAARHARGLGLAARTVEVWIDYVESGRERCARSMPEPSDQDAVLYDRARRTLLTLFTRREALRRVGVALSRFSAGVAAQADLFDGETAIERERLTQSLDLVRDRFGHASVVAGPSVQFLGRLVQDRNGFVLRTPSLTK